MNYIVFLFALAILQSTTINAQSLSWDAGCVYEDQACQPWTYVVDELLSLNAPDCYAEITYQYRVCMIGGQPVTKIIITSWQVNGGCTGFDQKQVFHHDYNGQKEYVILGLLSEKFQADIASYPCPDGKQIASVYTAACGIWACCEYEVTATPPVCDQGYDLPHPHYGTPSKVRVCKWQSCGNVCCRRIYSMCDEEGTNARKIELISKTPLGDCSEQNKYGAKGCENGC